MSLKTEDNTANHRDKVEQYVYNSSGPFDASACESATGVCINTVRRYLKIFEDWGLIRKIRHGNQRIYTRRKVTAEVKYHIKMAKMRTPVSMLKDHEMFYLLAGTIFGIFTFGTVA